VCSPAEWAMQWLNKVNINRPTDETVNTLTIVTDDRITNPLNTNSYLRDDGDVAHVLAALHWLSHMQQ